MLNLKTGILDKNYKIKGIEIKNKHMTQRLNALGLTPGSKLKIKQKCLFSGPCILEINGQNLSIRSCDACHILLEEAHG
ncbi:ferrous iron transporter A [Staphylococcus xylosus]|uniref:FeoA family protein n=1 Tax=Staphylococcus TaxID=1279 RepID=UPI000D1E15FF|nr:ferrous iron transport protein A [Staphylococcus xylosus]MRF34232.1 ferrous iron transporter A [Staphylococcus sp. KY49P]PTI04490.1 ferrous iron transporter A [Staphylococcus xylosus]